MFYKHTYEDNLNKVSNRTNKAIIADIIDRKAKYEEEAKTDLDKGIALGYEFVFDSIKNQLECKGYNFKDWIEE